MLTVLASVTDKSGLDNFLRRLERFDQLRLIATTSTARFLLEQGFACTKVEELTGFPEILSGRVKTLHPRVFAGILARGSDEDRSCLEEMDISKIDMVVVNLYRFEDKLSEGLTEPEMIEHIDVGGVALLRAAAKNYERVTVISSPNQYETVIQALEQNGGNDPGLRKKLAQAAFDRTSRYDQSIASYLTGSTELASRPLEASGVSPTTLPESFSLNLIKHQDLRYGENPHQAAAWYCVSPASSKTKFPPFEQLQGKELSSNNITDTYALISILREISSPAACIIKHNNPCGVAKGQDLQDAYRKAYDTDPLSAFGGVYGFTDLVKGDLAKNITENFVEIVAAPAFDKDALDVFKKKKNVRVLEMFGEGLSRQAEDGHLKDLRDFGYLLERNVEPQVEAANFTCVTEKKLDQSRLSDVAFAWAVVKHLTSNAIFVAQDGCSLGFGIGQTSRIASVDLALNQAGQKARGAVLASDAFFPATDNIESAAKSGIEIIVQPGGSLKDADVIAACNAAGIVMLFTGQRCFKH